MKITFYKLLILSLMTFCKALGQNVKPDTLFIYKDSLKGVSQSIFFETNKKNKYYKNITSFQFDEFDKETYDNSLAYLKAHNIKLKKQKPILPGTKWITLKQLNGQFYAYYPCDFYAYYQASINDTTYIDWTGEGPVANKITKQAKLNDASFEIKVTGLYEQNRTIIIKIIDKAKGIAVFTDSSMQNEKTHYLMIMSEYIKKVPFIVNNCQARKQSEFNFEEPNFDELLKK